MAAFLYSLLFTVELCDQFGFVGDIQFAIDVLQMGFDCMGGNMKLFGNLCIVVALCQEHEQKVLIFLPG